MSKKIGESGKRGSTERNMERKKRETKRPSSSSGDEEEEETEKGKTGHLKKEIDSLDSSTDESEEELRKMKLNPTPKKSSGSSDYRMYKTDPQEHSVC